MWLTVWMWSTIILIRQMSGKWALIVVFRLCSTAWSIYVVKSHELLAEGMECITSSAKVLLLGYRSTQIGRRKPPITLCRGSTSDWWTVWRCSAGWLLTLQRRSVTCWSLPTLKKSEMKVSTCAWMKLWYHVKACSQFQFLRFFLSAWACTNMWRT